jgi:peptide/nickel transport system permease protein
LEESFDIQTLAAGAGPSGLQAETGRRLGSLKIYTGSVLLGLTVVLAIISAFWTPRDPNAIHIDHPLAGPERSFLLGTDAFGRDVLSRIMVGAGSTLFVAAIATAFATLLGCVLAGFCVVVRSVVETVIMRMADIVLGLPGILLAIVLTASLGPGNDTLVIAIALSFAPVVTRITRSGALEVMHREFVLAARAYGRGSPYIFFRHVLPNIAGLIIVQTTVLFATAILVEAALSYLGFGDPPPTASWGVMLSDAQAYVFTDPLLAVWPGLAIMVSVLGLGLLGDGLRDRFDPKLQMAK